MDVSINVNIYHSHTHVCVLGINEYYETDSDELRSILKSASSYMTTLKEHSKNDNDIIFNGRVLKVYNSSTNELESFESQLNIYLYSILYKNDNILNIELIHSTELNKSIGDMSFNSSLSASILQHENDSMMLNTSYTYSVWFYAVSENPGCIFSSNGLSILLQPFGTIFNTSLRSYATNFENYLPYRAPNIKWNDSRWHCYTHVYDKEKGNLEMFIDGERFGRMMENVNISLSNTITMNGCLDSTKSIYDKTFSGCIAYVFISNRKFTHKDCKKIYNKGYPSTLTGVDSLNNTTSYSYILNNSNLTDTFNSTKRLKCVRSNNTLQEGIPQFSTNIPNGNVV
jgi:hypothetical protein